MFELDWFQVSKSSRIYLLEFTFVNTWREKWVWEEIMIIGVLWVTHFYWWRPHARIIAELMHVSLETPWSYHCRPPWKYHWRPWPWFSLETPDFRWRPQIFDGDPRFSLETPDFRWNESRSPIVLQYWWFLPRLGKTVFSNFLSRFIIAVRSSILPQHSDNLS